MPNAPPARVPFSAAMVRQGSAAIAPDSRSQTGSVASPARASSRSAPAENTPPVPVSTRTRTPDAAAASTVSAMSASIARVSAFARSGRSITTRHNAPSFWTDIPAIRRPLSHGF